MLVRMEPSCAIINDANIYYKNIYKHRSALETNSYGNVYDVSRVFYCLNPFEWEPSWGSPTQWSCIKDATRRRFWHSELALAWNVFDVSGSKNQHRCFLPLKPNSCFFDATSTGLETSLMFLASLMQLSTQVTWKGTTIPFVASSF